MKSSLVWLVSSCSFAVELRRGMDGLTCWRLTVLDHLVNDLRESNSLFMF